MPMLYSIYRKFRFPVKFLHAAIKYPGTQRKVKKLSVISIEETINRLLQDEKLSLARYGDGELEMTYYKNIGFQPFDERLSARLKALLQSDPQANPRCLLCLPDAFRSTRNMRFGSALFWFFHKSFFFSRYESLLNKTYQYGNTSVTRPYHDYKTKNLSHTIFDKFKLLFKDRKILIVEGSGTRLGLGNDLLAGAKVIKRITTLNHNAFSVYDRLYASVLASAHEFDVVLISLGPTATVLAYDLSQQGIRCIDSGHMDIEYEWMLASATNKMKVEGKNVNEVGVLLSEQNTVQDSGYQQQILCHIGEAAEATEAVAVPISQPLPSAHGTAA
ncbi:MAG: GT-D fold domain-containing glycosyltransferase [Enterobacterales bacterium endosymbiont of Blomia tropicalis]|uniref:GT-D fold domain-containing glycosyltransferase n=1 Tax=Mixta mediterraneensis TaxID=2758443 RepID=UPI0025A85C5D|nr:GT-D fold domain-containing glycosyltransferase [Mixta mediterraneensis]MDL4915958.1 GT-D fold domain-containing glycosyltransferase [Mixta mediterraneensis]